MKILNPVPEKSIFPPALYQELDVYSLSQSEGERGGEFFMGNFNVRLV